MGIAPRNPAPLPASLSYQGSWTNVAAMPPTTLPWVDPNTGLPITIPARPVAPTVPPAPLPSGLTPPVIYNPPGDPHAGEAPPTTTTTKGTPPPPGGGGYNPPEPGIDPNNPWPAQPKPTVVPPSPPGTILPPSPPGTTTPPAPVGKDVNAYLAQLMDYLNSQREAWQQQYRGLGNTNRSWYDWAQERSLGALGNWIEQNWTPENISGDEWTAGFGQLQNAWQNWLKQNSVNYTNPARLPQPNRMQAPVTDWTRLAGPTQGIQSGFAERAQASPWAASYRGGAFGPTGRTPSWTQVGK
jgi:hypothetical protein